MSDETFANTPAVSSVDWENTVGLRVHNDQIICDGIFVESTKLDDIELNLLVGHIASMKMNMDFARSIFLKA